MIACILWIYCYSMYMYFQSKSNADASKGMRKTNYKLVFLIPFGASALCEVQW